jgi:heat shock protein HtpX
MTQSQLVGRTDVYREIRRNKWRTSLTLLPLVALVVLVGFALDVLAGVGVAGVVVALVIAAGLALFAYYYGDQVALRAAHVKPADGPEYQRLHNIVEGLCVAAGLPKPALYVIDDPSPNAFVTGRNPKHASIAVTAGLLQMVNRVELEGVIAHELSHVKNDDILAGTVAVIAVGTIARVVPPLGARIMRLSMDRTRDLLADATGVQLTRYPPGLCSALKKVRDHQAVVRYASRATAQLWIESPLDGSEGTKGSWLNRAFDTHPPLEERIRVLEGM